MCGAIRPTKPTMPEIATPAPTASATCATSLRFSRSTSTPTWPASRSPSASASSRCAAGSKVGTLTSSTSSAGTIAAQVTAPKPPMVQKMSVRSCWSSAMNTSMPMPAEVSALIAMPASSRVPTRVTPSRAAMR